MPKLSWIILCLLCAIFLASHAGAYDLGDGKFIFYGFVHKQEGKNGAYIITDYDDSDDKGNSKEYIIKPDSLKNYPAIKAALTQTNENNHGYRFTGVWAKPGELDLGQLNVEAIRGEKDCPEKTFATKTITGTYMGDTDEGDYPYALIRDDNGKEFAIQGYGEEFFGNKTNIKVKVTYNVAQFWNEFGGCCQISEVLKDGVILK